MRKGRKKLRGLVRSRHTVEGLCLLPQLPTALGTEAAMATRPSSCWVWSFLVVSRTYLSQPLPCGLCLSFLSFARPHHLDQVLPSVHKKAGLGLGKFTSHSRHAVMTCFWAQGTGPSLRAGALRLHNKKYAMHTHTCEQVCGCVKLQPYLNYMQSILRISILFHFV